MNELSQVKSVYKQIYFGCDPEFFFEKDGKIVGSEKVLKGGGVEVLSDRINDNLQKEGNGGFSAFVLDGVQVELNPNAHKCRQALGVELSLAFKALRLHLDKSGGFSACFKQTIEVDKKELKSLSDKSREFGCAPSLNIYDEGPKIQVDAAKYHKRSAGGHIHIGLKELPSVFEHRLRLLPLMDILVGLTCVLIDRDPGNVERRKYYGRAGEHRLPDHGLEYRTLSNFWLRSYPLMGLVMGLTRMAVSVLNTTLTTTWDAERELIKCVDMRKVVEAINTNNLKIAQEQFLKVREFICNHVVHDAYSMGLSKVVMENFDFFLKKGIDHWFPNDPMDTWCSMKDNNPGDGIENYLINKVGSERLRELVGA